MPSNSDVADFLLSTRSASSPGPAPADTPTARTRYSSSTRATTSTGARRDVRRRSAEGRGRWPGAVTPISINRIGHTLAVCRDTRIPDIARPRVGLLDARIYLFCITSGQSDLVSPLHILLNSISRIIPLISGNRHRGVLRAATRCERHQPRQNLCELFHFATPPLYTGRFEPCSTGMMAP